MRSFFSRFKFLGLVLLLLSGVIIYLFYNALKPKKLLPVYSPAMVNSELVPEEIQHIRKYHTIADFSLTNQNGEIITEAAYEGKIYIADFFFTTCPTICPIMTKNMVDIQELIMDDPDAFDMIHTENFILVDKEKRIRGFYDGTKKEHIKELLGDLEILKASYAE